MGAADWLMVPRSNMVLTRERSNVVLTRERSNVVKKEELNLRLRLPLPLRLGQHEHAQPGFSLCHRVQSCRLCGDRASFWLIIDTRAWSLLDPIVRCRGQNSSISCISCISYDSYCLLLHCHLL
jgi:hypothetical protein